MLYFDPQTRRGVVVSYLGKGRAALGVVRVNYAGTHGAPIRTVRVPASAVRSTSVRTFGTSGPKVYVFEARERVARLMRETFPEGFYGRKIAAKYCTGLTPKERRERREKMRAQAPQFG